MQSYVFSGDPCSENAVSTKLSGFADVPVDETLVKEEGLRREKESEGMEVDNIGEGLNDGGEASSLKVEMGSLNVIEEGFNDPCVEKERNDLEAIEGVINQDSSVKANFNSFAQQLFPNPVSVGRSGKEVETKKSIENPSGEAKSGVDDEGGGFSEYKEVSLVVDLDDCVGKIKKKGKNKGGFCASDLVWGKVKSHPWWPAQIFEAGDASEKARKHFKSKGYFVGYFGDQTFAWNDEAKLKPFAPNFSQMVKQTQMASFRHAVNCVLVEISRRVEFGLSCHCIADEVYNQLKTQVVENDGIQEQSRIREGGDRFYTAPSFEPVKFLHYVKDLAQGSYGDADRLEHVIARAQMAAFYRWKGIYHLAEFAFFVGYVNNEADAPVEENCEPVTTEEDDNRPQKRKKTSNDNKTLRKEDGKGTNGKFGSKPISSSAPRQKEVKSFPSDSTTMKSKDEKPSFRVGESILRVAGQLSRSSSPLLKLDVSSRRKTNKDEGNNKQCSKLTSEYASIDVILSELHLAAIQPLKYSLLSKMVAFICVFRNSIVPDSELLQKHEKSGEEDTSGIPVEGLSGSGPAEMDAEGCYSGTKSKSKASESEITTTSDVKAVEDACCTNNTIKVFEQQTFLSDVKMIVVEPDHSEVDGISAGLLEMESTVSSPPQHYGSENGTSEGGQLDVKKQQEDSPTALTLKFTNMDSIPTEAKLIKIFSRFGLLKESETEVLAKKLCARVVFKRRSDAETAFSSSGKFEIFGPSLVCYRLNYAPSPRKSSSIEAKRRRKD